MVIAHGMSAPEAFSPFISATENYLRLARINFRIYLLWHLGVPVALFAYVWLRDDDRTKAGAHGSTALVVICSVAGVLVLTGCSVRLAVGDGLLPPAIINPDRSGPIAQGLIASTMLICAAALFVLWVFRRSAVDQWLVVVVLASIVELAITALFGATRFTLGFYAGRAFSVVTSTLLLTVLLAETTRLYGRLAHANMMASAESAPRQSWRTPTASRQWANSRPPLPTRSTSLSLLHF
jgi:hypothetical protein